MCVCVCVCVRVCMRMCLRVSVYMCVGRRGSNYIIVTAGGLNTDHYTVSLFFMPVSENVITIQHYEKDVVAVVVAAAVAVCMFVCGFT